MKFSHALASGLLLCLQSGLLFASCPPCNKEVCSGIPGIACACIPIPGCGGELLPGAGTPSYGCGLGDKVHLVVINKSDIRINYKLDGVDASLDPGMQSVWDTCRKVGEGVAKRNVSFDSDLSNAFVNQTYLLEFCGVAQPGIACSYSFKRTSPNSLDLFKE